MPCRAKTLRRGDQVFFRAVERLVNRFSDRRQLSSWWRDDIAGTGGSGRFLFCRSLLRRDLRDRDPRFRRTLPPRISISLHRAATRRGPALLSDRYAPGTPADPIPIRSPLGGEAA